MIKKLLLLLFLICLPLASARAEDILCPHDSEYKGSVSCRCAADYKGNAEKCKQDQICSSVSGEYKCYTKDGYKEAGGKLDGGKCLPIKKLNSYEISKGGSCTLCVIIKVVFNTVSKVAAKADSAFSASTIAAVIAGFAVWLAVYALGYLASVETRDAKDILQELLSMGAVVTLVVIILQNGSSNFYSAFINPVYETGLAGAQAALKSANYTATGNMTVSQISGGLPASMGNSILSTMTAMESSVSKIRAFGSSMICYSWEKKVLLFIPRFSYLITGLFYWVMAMAIIIIVPLLMVDFVFELGAALALLPPAIGCYPFRATREFSKKVWETFLNSSFGFLFTSLVLIIIVKALEKCVEVSFKKSGVSFDSLFTDSSGDMETFLTGFHWTGEVTVRMVFGFILAWACMNLGKQFAKEFAGSISSPGGKSGGLGSSVGTMFASAGKSTLAKVTAPTRHAASKWMGKTSRAIAQRATQSAANARDRRRTRRQQKRFDNAEQNGNLIRNADGTTSIRRKRMFGLLGDKVTTRKADGSFVVSREKAGWQKALSETRRNVLKSSENAIEI
ncbi:MAG: hypothetical protein IJ529_05210, partial [Alphaproteobacteria bacterium]|nr:hypothetical protein [Alphaproteobacteria bacterium]